MSETAIAVQAEIVDVESLHLGVADDVIAGLALRVKGAKADTPAGMKIIIGALAECRKLKRQATGNHKDLKESALKLCQSLDTEKRTRVETDS